MPLKPNWNIINCLLCRRIAQFWHTRRERKEVEGKVSAAKILPISWSHKLSRAAATSTNQTLFPGLPDGLFCDQKIAIWVHFWGPCNERCWYIFYGQKVYFTAIWYRYFRVIWHIFPRFGILYQEKIWQPWAKCVEKKSHFAKIYISG
jgi:hypothetical protein